MSKQSKIKNLSLTLGAAAVASLGASGIANAEADENLFSMDELSSGYLIAGAHEKKDDGDKKDGEGKCGEDKKDGEGKCGEGKCGSS